MGHVHTVNVNVFNQVEEQETVLWTICLFSPGHAIHITVLALCNTAIEEGPSTCSYRSEYQCYRSLADENSTLSFGRTAPIPSPGAQEAPSPDPHFNNPKVQVVTFPDTPDWDTDGFGSFYCEATVTKHNESHSTKVPTFFVRSDGGSYSRLKLIYCLIHYVSWCDCAWNLSEIDLLYDM